MMGRYFAEDNPHLASVLEAHFERLRAECPPDLQPAVTALILGGGYGRGEGGISQDTEGDDILFNDLDYFLFTPDPNRQDLVNWVRQWEVDETRVLGIDVECMLLPSSKISQPEFSMMFSDLALGHHVIMGPKEILKPWRERLDPARIPLFEATRLLWNRGSGLYFSLCALAEPEVDRTFIQRNHSKAKLALGDALLCRNGQYTASAQERGERLESLEDDLLSPQIQQWHREAVAFKMRPLIEDCSVDHLKGVQEGLVRAWARIFLAVESERLQCQPALETLLEYAWYPGRLFPETRAVRNLLLAVRDRLKRKGGLRPVLDYPRGGLYRSLCELLHCSLHPGTTAHLRTWIVEAASEGVSEQHRAIYEKWWHHYS
jgi:hypothetical protein